MKVYKGIVKGNTIILEEKPDLPDVWASKSGCLGPNAVRGGKALSFRDRGKCETWRHGEASEP